MSKNKPNLSEDPFATIPPREFFDAFPSLAAFPEDSIAFLTGKAPAVTAQQHPVPIKPDTKPERQPDTQSDTRPANQPASQPEKPPISQPQSQSASLSATQKADQSASLSKNQTKNQSQSRSKGQTIDHSLGRTKSQSRDLSSSRTMGLPKVGDRLNDNQRQVLDLLLATKPYIIKFRDIAEALGMREASVRTVMRRLDALGFLSFRKARDGNLQGVGVTFNQPVIEQYQQDRPCSLSINLSLSRSTDHTASPTKSQSQDHSGSQPHTKPASQSASHAPPLKIEKIENLSIQAWEGWDDGFVELIWPRVFAAGLRRGQLEQARAAREKLGKTLERDMTALSLDRAEWELENKGKLVDLQTGEPVRNVAAYIFTALARWSVLRAHPEYVSREEAEAEAAVAAMRRRKEALETLENVRFEQYRDALTPLELEAILQGFPGGSKDAWIKAHWRKNVRDAS